MKKMKSVKSPLHFIFFLLLLLPLPSISTPFVCTTPRSITCQSLIGYISPNRTTYTALKSLFSIKSIRSIFSANNLPPSTPSSTSIRAGSTVRIPIPCSCSAGSGSSFTRPIYAVKPGDGLDAIARNDYSGFVTFQDIAAANNISNTNLIVVGQRLLIPLPCSCDLVDGVSVVHYAHLVVAGSSVKSIADEFRVSQDTLLRINGIDSPKNLNIGQVLDVPLRACSSSISNSSLDHNLLIPKNANVLTAKNCILCSCSSATWKLDCHPIQGISNSSCPAATCGSLLLGNTSASACETSTCSYAGYTPNSILTLLTNQSTCNGTDGPAPGPGLGSAPLPGNGIGFNGVGLVDLHIALALFALWNGLS